MALPSSAERNGGESPVGDARRLNIPTPFLTKTYQLVDDRDVDGVVSWNADGTTFIVWNAAEFARDLLPKYFKHNNFSSFVRQLNTYGFRKVEPDRWEFSNDCFRRGEKRLLRDIHRRKIAAPPSTTATPFRPPRTASPSGSGEEQLTSTSVSPSSVFSFGHSAAELIEENKRLKKENVKLSKELRHMKSLCNSIYSLMSSFNSNQSNGDDGRSCKLYPAEAKHLDLLPMTRFVGEIDGGAAAEEIGGKLIVAEDGMDLELQLHAGEIKSEP